MLNTQEVKFYVRLISSRWYQENKDVSNKPFIVADKFNNPSAIIKSDIVNNYLCAINKENSENKVESDDESEEELGDIGDRNNEKMF
ncbi:unnamed protein product [Rhizophagus irregularis]|nr:unnamed protein product [Rhizophagus irregularis]CAB4406044.1 unnamed protein product [Rhizophagus irregularis]